MLRTLGNIEEKVVVDAPTRLTTPNGRVSRQMPAFLSHDPAPVGMVGNPPIRPADSWHYLKPRVTSSDGLTIVWLRRTAREWERGAR